VAYLAGLVLTALFVLALHYFTELTKKQKVMTLVVIFTLIFGAYLYNTYNAMQREKMLSVVTKYRQGKAVHCQGREVNATTYSLSVGTYTFIGKKGTPHYSEMISVSSCE